MLTARDQLFASHDEFRKLAMEHTLYEKRLDSLTEKRYLTDDEKLEEVRLKKLKLRLKDQMENIQRQYRQQPQQNQVSYSSSNFVRLSRGRGYLFPAKALK